MSEEEIEIVEAGTSVNEFVARQAGDFLDTHGKSEMAMAIKFLLQHYERTCGNKDKVFSKHALVSYLQIITNL